MAAKKKVTGVNSKDIWGDKTVVKALGLSGGIYGGAPCAVDVRTASGPHQTAAL